MNVLLPFVDAFQWIKPLQGKVWGLKVHLNLNISCLLKFFGVNVCEHGLALQFLG